MPAFGRVFSFSERQSINQIASQLTILRDLLKNLEHIFSRSIADDVGISNRRLTAQVIQAKSVNPVITSAATASGTMGSSFVYQITATNNPTSFDAYNLPPGITIDASTGLISGISTVSGIFQVPITATNSADTGTLSITIVMNDGTDTFTRAESTTSLGTVQAVAETSVYAESFDTGVPTGWILDAPVNGVGWAVDNTPTTVIPGAGIAHSGTSLNFNNGVNYDGGVVIGNATSPVISLSGLTNPVLKFWDLYQTETRGTATDKRFLEIWNAAGTTRLAQWQLASVGYSFGGGSAYQAAGPGPCGETHLDLETNTASSAWHQHKVYLDPAWGSVKIKFIFNSVDNQRNGYAGWGVDDLEVISNLTPVPTSWTDLWPWSFPPQPSIPTGSKLESFLFGSDDSLQWGWSIFSGSLSGTLPYLVVGDPGPPDPTYGSEAQLGSSFVVNDAVHGHRHVTQMVDFALWQDQPGTGLVKVRRGTRRGYCIISESNQGSPKNPVCEDPTATWQRLAGNSSYAAGTPEQELSVAGLARNAEYYLIGINDPLNRIREINNTNQHDNVRFILPTKAGERSKPISRTNPYPPSGAALTITSTTMGARNGARALKVTGAGFDTLMTSVLYDQGTMAIEQPFYTIVSPTEMWMPVPSQIKFPASLDLIRASGHIATTRLAAPDTSILPTDFIWDDDNTGGTSGNNNKQLNRGETVGLTIRLGNAGAQLVRGVTGTLSFVTPDSNLTIAQPTVSYGDLNPGVESSGNGQYRLVVSPTASVPLAIPLQLTITDSNGASWVSPVHVMIQFLPDTTAPIATITTPVNNFTIPPGTTVLTIAASASDPTGAGQIVSGVWGVQFKADGVVVPISPSLLEDLTPPYGTTWNLTGVKSGPHTITAIARDAAGNITTSPPITVTIPSDTTPPVISGITITSLTSTSITVTWQTNEPTNTSLCIQNGCSGSITPTTSHTRTLLNLTPNTFYQFWITATDIIGNTTITPKQSFVTPVLPSSDTTSPLPPGNPTGAGLSFYEIALNWQAATDNVGVVGYRIWRQIGTGASVLFDATTGTTYRDLAVTPGTTYAYEIRAYDAAGNVSAPATVTASTPTPDPTKLFVRTWGSNTFGQLGDNTTTSRSIPTTLVLEDVTALTSGTSHVLALRADGTLWAWGWNQGGQLGDGTILQRSVPVAVLGLPALMPSAPGLIPIAAGVTHSLALAADGTVWRWGQYLNNSSPIAGLPNSSVPLKMSGLTSVMALASGGNHSLALQSDGTLWSWGANLYGQLGDGTNTSRAAPVRVQGFPAGVKVTAMAAGDRHSFALLEDGTVWAWGDNFNGQLGDNTTTRKSTPTQVHGPGNVGVLTNIIAIASGSNSYHILALKRDGTLWAWGNNANGQLGDNTSVTQRNTPVPVTGLNGVRAIAVGNNHSLAALADGTVWAWGKNNFGELGNPVAVNHLQPVAVAGLASITKLAAGGNSSYSLSLPSVALPTVAFAGATTSIGERTGTIAIPVTLSAPYASPVTVDYAATGGIATGGGVDYTLFPGTLTFAPNQTTSTIELVLIDDTLVEPNETIELTLTNPSNAALGSPSVHIVTITDNETLAAPVITSPATANGTVGQPFNYQISATNNPTSFGASGLPTGFSVNTTTGLISGTPTVADTSTVTLRATNAAGTGTGTLILTIVVGNRAPVATGGLVTTPEDTPLGLTLDASDPDTNPLTYMLVTLPTHGTLSGTAPALAYTPALNYAGPDSFTFKANDGQLDSNVATISLTITPVNDPPVATHIAAHQYFLQENDPMPLIDLTIFDVDTPLGNLTLTARTSNSTLVPLANIQFSGSGAARFAQITLAPDQSGTADVTLLVSDGQDQDGHGFNLVVSPSSPSLTNLTFKVSAQGAPSSRLPQRIFTISVLDSAGNVLSTFNASPDTQGNIVKPSLSVAPGTYTLKISAPGYLVRKSQNVPLQSNAMLNLPLLLAGDFNQDNAIDNLDPPVIFSRWFTSDVATDMNIDNIINSMDFGFMNINWGKQGE